MSGRHTPRFHRHRLRVPAGSIAGATGARTWLVEFERYASRYDVDLILEWSADLDGGGWAPVARSLGGGPVEVLNGGVLVDKWGVDESVIMG